MKFGQIRRRIEIRNWVIYDIKKDNSIANPRNQKSGNLDENSQSNRRLKLGENSYRKIDLKHKLNATRVVGQVETSKTWDHGPWILSNRGH